MPEEQNPTANEAEDTSVQTPAAADSPDGNEGTPAQEVTVPDGYIEEDRYKEAQAWGTQAAQEAAQLRQVIDLARAGDPEALDYLGWAPPEQEEELLTQEEQLEQRLAALEQERQQEQEFYSAQQQEQEFEEAEQKFYQVELNRLKLDTADDSYQNMVVGVAQSFLDEDGLPDLEAAHKAIQEYTETSFKNRVKNKRNSPQAPSGASPVKEEDLDDDNTRREYLLNKMMEREEEE